MPLYYFILMLTFLSMPLYYFILMLTILSVSLYFFIFMLTNLYMSLHYFILMFTNLSVPLYFFILMLTNLSVPLYFFILMLTNLSVPLYFFLFISYAFKFMYIECCLYFVSFEDMELWFDGFTLFSVVFLSYRENKRVFLMGFVESRFHWTQSQNLMIQSANQWTHTCFSCIPDRVFCDFHQCWQILSYIPLSNPWDT